MMLPRIRLDFPRWEGDPTGWISRIERYFRYSRTLEDSMVDTAVNHLEGDAIRWYNWLECTHGAPTDHPSLESARVLTKVFHTDLYRPYRAIHTGPLGYRYAGRPLLGGTAKIDCRRSIEGEINRRRSIEGEKGKKKKRKRRKKKQERRKNKKKYLAPSLPARRRRPLVMDKNINKVA
ncbi:hypothetical protein GW17_00056208 [Ensete ventricosum]|nr:hypothetical protein GW17_00056208 [Ensete ventricosum]